jgi:hypothetical protein
MLRQAQHDNRLQLYLYLTHCLADTQLNIFITMCFSARQDIFYCTRFFMHLALVADAAPAAVFGFDALLTFCC